MRRLRNFLTFVPRLVYSAILGIYRLRFPEPVKICSGEFTKHCFHAEYTVKYVPFPKDCKKATKEVRGFDCCRCNCTEWRFIDDWSDTWKVYEQTERSPAASGSTGETIPVRGAGIGRPSG